MFGLYRLLLALGVALSHVGLTFRGFNPGQWSVVCFYVLSGFLMERQFHKLAPIGGIRSFYLDRLLRIYPLYFVAVALWIPVVPVSWWNLLVNFSLVPLNYSAFTHVPILVGPAWSLACEVHFYLLVPFLAVRSSRVLYVLMAISMLIFAFSILLPMHGFWTYAALPGILFTFLSGMLINRRDWQALRLAYGVMVVLWIFFSCSKFFFRDWQTGLHINVCSGYLIAIPATSYLSHFSPRVAWDQFCGLFSYPLFLIHMLVMGLGLRYLPGLNIWEYAALSLAAAGALVLVVEKPFDVLRYRVRRTKPRSAPGATE